MGGSACAHLPLCPSLLSSQARDELRPVKEDFETKNKQLLEEMPKFYSSRLDYFKPSFESLIRAQVHLVAAASSLSLPALQAAALPFVAP